MELDSLFSTPRWKILEILARTRSSPLELSKLMNTSIAYISQQLKLLEASGIVLKERTRAVEKGKARNLYYLSNELVHFTALLKDHPTRKSLILSEHQKIVIKIWLLVDAKFSYFVEKLFWNIEEDLEEVSAILLENSFSKVNVIIISDSKKLKQKIESFSKKYAHIINLDIFSSSSLNKISSNKYFSIHDPQKIFVGKEKLKGGELKSEI